MRINNNLFLAKANLKGSKRKDTVMVMMILSVISVTLLLGFLGVANTVLEQNKNAKCYRQAVIFPKTEYEEVESVGVTNKNIKEILSIDHVISCEKRDLPPSESITVTKILDENNKNISNTTNETSLKKINEDMCSQIYDEDLVTRVIKGTNLDKSPVMSCILPDTFTYVEYDYKKDEFTGKKERIATESLLGKTLSVDLEYNIHLFKKSGVGYSDDSVNLPKISYQLKVVGIYHYSQSTALDGSPDIVISKETAKKIDKMALDNAVKNGMKDDLDDYINDDQAREYIVTADSIDNINEVIDTLFEKGVNVVGSAGILDESMLAFTGIFDGVGTFLTVAILLLTIINIFLSVHNNIAERKAEIGLMKAVGYKTSQIFYSMYLENIILAVKALLIGGALSAAAVLLINLVNSSGDTAQQMYVMPWLSFLILLAIAFGVILVIPLVCLLIMVYNIAKIQPQEAMNA